MSTKFFNNACGNTLFQKLKGIAENMDHFDRFLAVAGFFYSSGYFKLRKELEKVKEIKVLVGISVDNIFRNHDMTSFFMPDEQKALKVYEEKFKSDIVNAEYSKEVEEGILQMFDDLKNGRLQMKIHSTKNLHAKFYLCLPENHNEHTDGWVIMGSSNISDSGLGTMQTPRYELNVAMKDFEDVNYCHDEFKKLWEEAVPLNFDDIDLIKKKTYLGTQPTPYELYMKVLISAFGDQVEDDFTIQLPDGVKELKYQKDAVIQGYQMLLEHNGLFLADVVGLGKTMIATMIAKRFIEANGRNTSILVVHPPALKENWEQTFQRFGIKKKAQFITNGSLDKIFDGKDNYKEKEEFDLIIVDEAHGFRSDGTERFNELQKICKSPCCNIGLLKSRRKKVMLLSATPLNNRPEDLLNQLLLFQDSIGCTIDGIPNLKTFFTPFILKYKKLMGEREKRNITGDVDGIYALIREKVIDKVTIRRTRNNILNDVDYKADIDSQGIVFPKILAPEKIEYQMDAQTSGLFKRTLLVLSDEDNFEHLFYARYRAIEYLKPEFKKKYFRAEQMARTLAGIYRVHMVKRLESSFHAFKESLKTLLRTTGDMIKMFEADKVIIAPELKVKDLMTKGLEIDEIIERAMEKGFSKEDILYKAEDFDPKFLKKLKGDEALVKDLLEKWEKISGDQKFSKFENYLKNVFFKKQINPTGKLVLFSESVDTLEYLYGRFKEVLQRKDVLMVTSKNRDSVKQIVKENFDANSEVKKNDFNIIITSDVLAEGVNLHRSNVIINYDSPWNATRLMQRIGRVNRIGSVAKNVVNYMFYPSDEGNQEIKLKENALVKLQGFHSAYGEDAQIYSTEEIVKQFEMYDSNIKDSVDKKIALLREVRRLYNSNRGLYNKIKELPLKSRVMRNIKKHQGNTVVFVQSNVKTEFYLANGDGVEAIDFLNAVDYLEAKPEERPASFSGNEETHYSHVKSALDKFKKEYERAADTNTAKSRDLDSTSQEALKFLRTLKQVIKDNGFNKKCDLLKSYIEQGLYNKLPKRLKVLSREYKSDRAKIADKARILENEIDELLKEYQFKDVRDGENDKTPNDPNVVISESFA